MLLTIFFAGWVSTGRQQFGADAFFIRRNMDVSSWIIVTLGALLVYSYRYTVYRYFRINFGLLTNSAGAASRAKAQVQKIADLKNSIEPNRQGALGIHADLDHVDTLLG